MGALQKARDLEMAIERLEKHAPANTTLRGKHAAARGLLLASMAPVSHGIHLMNTAKKGWEERRVVACIMHVDALLLAVDSCEAHLAAAASASGGIRPYVAPVLPEGVACVSVRVVLPAGL